MTLQLPKWQYALSEVIHNKALDDRTTNIFVYGEGRIGKSVFCMKVMKELFARSPRFQPHDEDYWRKFVCFRPVQLINTIRYLRERNEKAEGILLDDFGLWGFAWDWTDPDLKSAVKLMQVAGTITDALFITAPSTQMVVKKVLTLEGILVGKVIKLKAEGYRRDLRRIILYRNGLAPWGKRYINTATDDTFSVTLNQRDYDWYKPLREGYVDEARKQMELSLRR